MKQIKKFINWLFRNRYVVYGDGFAILPREEEVKSLEYMQTIDQLAEYYIKYYDPIKGGAVKSQDVIRYYNAILPIKITLLDLEPGYNSQMQILNDVLDYLYIISKKGELKPEVAEGFGKIVKTMEELK